MASLPSHRSFAAPVSIEPGVFGRLAGAQSPKPAFRVPVKRPPKSDSPYSRPDAARRFGNRFPRCAAGAAAQVPRRRAGTSDAPSQPL